MSTFSFDRRITKEWRTFARVIICGAICLISLVAFFAPSTQSAENTDSIQKRKDAIFKLADKIGEMKYPTRGDVEKLIGRRVWAKSAGWYSSDIDKTQDIEYFLVPYDGELKVTCVVLAINSKLDIRLKDVERVCGKFDKTYTTKGIKEYNFQPAIIYCYNSKKRRMDFKFRKKNQQQVDSITVVPSTTPDLNLRL